MPDPSNACGKKSRGEWLAPGFPALYLIGMFIVTPSTLLNARALQMQAAPKRMLRRISIVPRVRISAGMWARLIFEVQILRYLVPLIPFIVAMFVWPDLALPISQAPIPMMLVIAFFETRVLSIKPTNRSGLISDADMARTEDALRYNARSILRRIAAKRMLSTEEILLVVEQSTLARVPPLTLVSVQEAEPQPRVLDLDAEERALIEASLFDDDISERDLHCVALRQNENLRAISFDASTLSAHERMRVAVGARAPVAVAEAP
jgi:hypothetical protein